MKKIILLASILQISLFTTAQRTYIPSGNWSIDNKENLKESQYEYSGIVTTNMNTSVGTANCYSHYDQYDEYDLDHKKWICISNITVNYRLFILLGEPVIDGIFKWEIEHHIAEKDIRRSFLDYNDCVLLAFLPKANKYYGTYLYVMLSPTAPKAGGGYGYNTPGSPNRNDLFYKNVNGKVVKAEIPEADAKKIWKVGLKFDFILLARPADLKIIYPKKSNSSDDFRNIPENTTTQNDLKRKEAIERQKQFTQQAKDKYKALKKPYILNVTNRDTVSEINLQPLKAINPYFQNGTLTLSSVSNGKVIAKVNTVNSNLQLAEGWNTLRITIKGDNYNLKDSVRVYCKKDGRFGRMTDQQGNVYKTIKIGNQVWMAENLRYKTSSGCWAYNDDERNVKMYGYLYDWNTAKSICPPGWHLPSKSEWGSLIETLGGKEIAKTSLKSITGWNENGSNSSGFSALPGGFYTYYGKFQTLGSLGAWWSASTSANLAWMCSIEDKTLSIDTWNKDRRLSVRYIRDF